MMDERSLERLMDRVEDQYKQEVREIEFMRRYPTDPNIARLKGRKEAYAAVIAWIREELVATHG